MIHALFSESPPPIQPLSIHDPYHETPTQNEKKTFPSTRTSLPASLLRDLDLVRGSLVKALSRIFPPCQQKFSVIFISVVDKFVLSDKIIKQ